MNDELTATRLTRVVMLPVVVVQRRLGALDAARGAVHRRLHVVPRVVEGQVLGELLLAREVSQADGAALVALVVRVAGVLWLLGHAEIQSILASFLNPNK